MSILETQIFEERSPLYFPQVDPRPELVEEFSQRIQDLCPKTPPESMAFLLFQREMMLRRVADPTAVLWANNLDIEGDFQENQMLYVRYLVRKWLACLPPLFTQLSCLEQVSFTREKAGYDRVEATFMGVSPKLFGAPDKMFPELTAAFLKTIPFFDSQSDDLRAATLLVERTVFSLDEWWRAFVARFSKGEPERLVAEHLARDCIAKRLATYLEKPSSIHETSSNPDEAMVDILAHASIHSYVG